ncbi:MAG TPA: hypothetical protein VFS43_40140 [Polyangiaceae bacterium]|nr:hypothetical protein [Polyangiaceae bacterium]
MNPFFLSAIVEQAMPAVVSLIVFGSPLALVYTLRSFRLREKELDLKRALAERPRDEEIKALEERVERLEQDRAFFKRLAERSLRVDEAAPASPPAGARARVPEPIELEAILEAPPEAVVYGAPRNGAYAR